MKRFVEERYIVANSSIELEENIRKEMKLGWKPYGPSRLETIRDVNTGEYVTMLIQYACREEDTTYSSWVKENRRLSINHLDD